MSKDLAVDESGDIIIDPETGDLVTVEDDDQAVATNIALGTNEGELSWNPSFGLNHLHIIENLDDIPSLEAEIEDYLESQFDNFVSAEVKDIKRNGRTATVDLVVTYLDDSGEEITVTTGTEVDDIGID
ncbi:hypothetical protein [Levilactobacillus brevis]|uniref:hypothetical protein n=1 Tax=Levilactobacillus brevis TaxID=1580 RepID=UPI0011199010|nr:hypothetical protein [Levilactobacillus brevis]QCZ43712.1 hypothetical protein UCCLBBS124_1388 [Levilactobacillus brevis]